MNNTKRNQGWFAGKTLTIIYAFTILIPLYLMITTSLKSTDELYSNSLGLPQILKWENFAIAIKDGNIMTYAFNSMFVTTISVILIVIFQTLCAYGIYRIQDRLIGKIIYTVCIAGMIIPAVGYASIILLYRQMMLYNTLTALIVASLAGSLPFAVLILVGFLKTVPKELIEAAKIDGCSDFGILPKIIVPVITPAITTVGMLNMISVWNAVFMPLLLLSDKDKFTIPLGLLSFKGYYATQYNYMFAGVIMTAIPMLILYFVAQKKFVASLAGSVKG